MTVHEATTSVQESIVVDAPIERAFSVFTGEMESWWPPDHHILKAPLAEMVVEPREGATYTTAASTGVSVGGRGCSPTSRRHASCSAGTSL
jgi:hypothetical protein